MEILKPQPPARFTRGDLTILVRTRALEDDKLAIATDEKAYVDEKGRVRINQGDYARLLIQRFVVGWEGVTEGGKPVDYDYERLLELPVLDEGASLLLDLSTFILEHVDLFRFRKDEKRKNESPERSTGSSAPAPSTAAAETASSAPAEPAAAAAAPR